MRVTSAVIVGVGGTGSHLLEPLARTLVFHKNGVVNKKRGMVLIDGDKFERHNSSRQLGTVEGQYKVNAQASRLKSCFKSGELDIVSVPQYVDKHSFKELVLGGIPNSKQEPIIIVLAVDNHSTRKDVFESVREHGCENVLVLSPGNDVHHGQVLVYARIAGEDVTTYPLALSPDGVPFHPELLKPTDRIPGGCAAQAKGTPQLITANAFAANLCLSLIQAWLDDGDIVDEIHFDAKKFRVRASGSPISLKDVSKKLAIMMAERMLKKCDRLALKQEMTIGEYHLAKGTVIEVKSIENAKVLDGRPIVYFKTYYSDSDRSESLFTFEEHSSWFVKTDAPESPRPIFLPKGERIQPGDVVITCQTIYDYDQVIPAGSKLTVLKVFQGDEVYRNYGEDLTIVHVTHRQARDIRGCSVGGLTYPRQCYLVERRAPDAPEPTILPRPAPVPSKGTPKAGAGAELNVGDKVKLMYDFTRYSEDGKARLDYVKRGTIITVSYVHEKYYKEDSPSFRATEMGSRDWVLHPGDFERVDD